MAHSASNLTDRPTDLSFVPDGRPNPPRVLAGMQQRAELHLEQRMACAWARAEGDWMDGGLRSTWTFAGGREGWKSGELLADKSKMPFPDAS